MVRLSLFAFALLLFAMSCQSQKQKKEADHFILKGKLENASQINVLLQELTTRELITIDSFQTDVAGEFAYKGMTEEVSFFVLRVDDSNFITLLIEPGEELLITGNANNLANDYSVRGSEGSALLSNYYRRLNSNTIRLDSLREVYAAKRYADDFADIRDDLKSSYNELFHDQQRFVIRFIKKNPRSLASIIALYQFFGNKLLLNEDDHFAYFESLSISLSEVHPTNKHVMELNRRVSRLKRTELRGNLFQHDLNVGSEAPEVILPDPTGNPVALSSLRGQYVLIDFWASWCKPCRKANLEFQRIYNRYRDHGFEIYSISLDRTLEQWLQGIKDDGITWTQVSDLRSWNSPVVSLYGVERIPFAILTCPDGKIICNNISTDQLKEFLADLFDREDYLALP